MATGNRRGCFCPVYIFLRTSPENGVFRLMRLPHRTALKRGSVPLLSVRIVSVSGASENARRTSRYCLFVCENVAFRRVPISTPASVGGSWPKQGGVSPAIYISKRTARYRGYSAFRCSNPVHDRRASVLVLGVVLSFERTRQYARVLNEENFTLNAIKALGVSAKCDSSEDPRRSPFRCAFYS